MHKKHRKMWRKRYMKTYCELLQWNVKKTVADQVARGVATSYIRMLMR